MKETETMNVQNILMTLIDRPAVPDRLTIDSEYIKELASSIAEIGLMNPVLLCPRNCRYEIVAGDCRYQAFLSLGREYIPAVVRELDAENVSISRATENLQRNNLTVIEEARIYKNLHENHGMTWEQISKRTGKGVGTVKRRNDLLCMPEILIKAMHDKKISPTVAEELYALGDVGKIEYYLGFCIDHGATKEVVREWVKEEKSRERQAKNAGDGGGWGSAIPEIKPIYVSCDLCSGPMELSQVVSLRICKDCHGTIKNNM